MTLKRLVPLLALVLFVPAPVRAHPVPRSNHDRTIVVRLSWDAKVDRFVVFVDYRLEVDESTVLLDDMGPFSDQVDPAKFANKRKEFYAEFTRLYAPILASNLDAKANGKPLKLECVERAHRLKDEQGQELGHLRCDFRFRATFAPAPGRSQQITLREGNYELQTGKIDVALLADASVGIEKKTEPSAELKKRAERALGPGEEDMLRQVSATFSQTAREAEPLAPLPAADEGGGQPLLRLFRQADQYYTWLLLLLAAAFGAVHALTPGHGKTLVAAYLVGERGTTLHALVLGLVTTLTHTGVVFVIAVGLLFASEESRQAVASGLGLAMGLLIVCYGVWVLLRRLSGRADHVHIGGHSHHDHHHGHHHHHHAHTDHDHDAHGHVVPRKEPVGWWGLVVLGMSGGIVPCWDAVAMLALAVGMGQMGLALPLLVAFSAGLAAVLVLVGVLVVHVRSFAQSQWGEGRLVRALPIISAVAITALGFWLCYESVHLQDHGAPVPARAAVSPP
jgi:ABC-type nickel/cobalt efflux system permease component RcnA